MPSIADALGELNDKAMTRKEQIKEYLRIIGNGETMGIPFDAGFECGVEWADSHPHWISVEDELPEACVAVLTTTQHGTKSVGFYEDGWWLANSPDLVRMGSITHWMPLPVQPRGSSEFPNNCKKFDMKGYENVVIHEGNAKGGILKTIYADKVIAWLVANICDYDYYVKLFKKDFGI